MSKLSIELQEALNGIRKIEESGKELGNNFNILNGSFENLGNSWRDGEYQKAKAFMDKAKMVVDSYIKSTVEYTGQVTPRLRQLEQEYLESSESVGLDDLDLDLGGLDLELETKTDVDKEPQNVKTEEEYKGLKGRIDKYLDIIENYLDSPKEEPKELLGKIDKYMKMLEAYVDVKNGDTQEKDNEYLELFQRVQKYMAILDVVM